MSESHDDRRTRAEDTPPRVEDTAPVSLEAQVDELRRQLDDKQDRLLRALAEADNVRRRAQRDRDEFVKYANETLLRDLIPVLDNMDRALEAARAASGADGVVAGVELIQRELLRVLERAGVTRYSAMGQPFDPTRHEVVGVVDADGAGTPPGSVASVLRPGYGAPGRQLRPAAVTVAQRQGS